MLLAAPCRTGRTTGAAVIIVDKILKEMNTLNYVGGVKAVCIGPTRDSCERLYQVHHIQQCDPSEQLRVQAIASVSHFCNKVFKVTSHCCTRH